MTTPAAWRDCFIDPNTAAPLEKIALEQIDKKTFSLRSSLEFTGNPGIDDIPAEALVLTPADLGPGSMTDLNSVPAAMRWFVGRYGIHTPAALLHDRLIGETAVDGVSDAEADRFFRFMLEALGVRFLRRWLMWAAVAFGTRWRAGGGRRILLVLWVIAALAGMVSFLAGLVIGNPWLVVAAAVGPIPAAALWGRQFGAAILGAYCAPWLVPPTVVGAGGFAVYWIIEMLISVFVSDKRGGNQPISYKGF